MSWFLLTDRMTNHLKINDFSYFVEARPATRGLFIEAADFFYKGDSHKMRKRTSPKSFFFFRAEILLSSSFSLVRIYRFWMPPNEKTWKEECGKLLEEFLHRRCTTIRTHTLIRFPMFFPYEFVKRNRWILTFYQESNCLCHFFAKHVYWHCKALQQSKQLAWYISTPIFGWCFQKDWEKLISVYSLLLHIT